MNRLDWREVPLSGRVLIEASAGTGKTHAIALIYLRLILESAASKIVVERVPHRSTRLFLMAKTDAAQLGVVLMAIRQGAIAIGKRLATHFPASPSPAPLNGDTRQ